mgnify:CR=1 FL=1
MTMVHIKLTERYILERSMLGLLGSYSVKGVTEVGTDLRLLREIVEIGAN